MTAPTGIDLEAREIDMLTKLLALGDSKARDDLLARFSKLRALAASRAEQIAGMREALAFYANPESWTYPGQVNRDEMFDAPVKADGYGDRARAAKAAYDATQRKPTDG